MQSSSTSSVTTEVPQIEINSPSPSSSGLKARTVTTATKSESDNRESYEQPQQRFSYDAHIKQSGDSTTSVKPNAAQRKTTKSSTIVSSVKQRDQSDSKRTATTPINGNSNVTKTKNSSLHHTSTLSDEQHIVAPAPLKPLKLKEQIPTKTSSLINSHVHNKSNNLPRLFIALFDYDPNAMSPNKDNEEELPFKEGQLIRVRFY